MKKLTTKKILIIISIIIIVLAVVIGKTISGELTNSLITGMEQKNFNGAEEAKIGVLISVIGAQMLGISIVIYSVVIVVIIWTVYGIVWLIRKNRNPNKQNEK